MERFIGTKIIFAKKMSADEAIGFGYKVNGALAAAQGYEVEYGDKYRSWSPKTAFENAYRKTDGMPFGLAIEALKKGHKVARSGWNGKDMWIILIQAGNAMFKGLDMQDCIGMKTASPRGEIQPGWLASQADMLSDDWMIVK